MRSIHLFAPAMLAACLGAAPALAETTYKLDKIEINGLKSVKDADVRPALAEKPGDKITIAQITADQDLLVAALGKMNVTGGVKTSLRNKNNGHVDIIFDVNDNGIVKPEVKVVTRLVDPKLGRELFTGNTIVATDVLTEAAGLHEGDVLTHDSMTAAEKRIQDAYTAELKKRNRDMPDWKVETATAASNKDGEIDLTWKLTEGKLKRKTHAGDDNGYGTE